MNAKQIADELENIYWIQGDGKGKPFQQYADFVRQQQAEIEALKEIMVAAIKAGDWIVDGACDPDQYIGDRL